METDIRWKQRLQNYQKALASMRKAVELASLRELSDLEKQGLIQSFEFTFELAWNVMKDYLEEQGIPGIIGSKNAVRQAFSQGLITDGQIWMDMIQDRNLAAHSYDEDTANNINHKIKKDYYQQLAAFANTMNNRD